MITNIWRFGGDKQLRAALPHLEPIAHPRALVMSTYFVGYWEPGHHIYLKVRAMQWSYSSRFLTEIYDFILKGTPNRQWFSFDTYFKP